MSPNELTKKAQQVKMLFSRDLPNIAAVEGVKHFKRSFQKGIEGFTDDTTIDKWPDIQPATKARKRRKNGSLPPILTGVDGPVNSGNLHDSITARHQPGLVIFSTDVPYAQRHNEGLKGMPKRQFWGRSKALERKITAKLDRELRKIFNA